MEITLPNQWRPRGYQRRLWNYLEGNGKRAVAVWHRRAGKDEVCLHWAACAAMQRVGNYWHMLPEASQARKAIWDAINPHTGRRRIDEAFPPSIRVGQRDEDMRIKLANRHPDINVREFVDRLCGVDGEGISPDRLSEVLRTLDQLDGRGS
jgi:phage terminase large subunit